MSVTLVSCVYGGTFHRFAPRWLEYVRKLNPKPDEIIVAGDAFIPIPTPGVFTYVDCDWKHPQAFYLNHAISKAKTDWVWILDIDDCAMPDALAGLDDVKADVWQMGYVRSDGEVYVPGETALVASGNALVAGSAIRTESFRRVGGFRDVAFQDWDLWSRLRENEASFAFSGRTHFHYMRHQYTRSATELTPDRREEYVAEMRHAA